MHALRLQNAPAVSYPRYASIDARRIAFCSITQINGPAPRDGTLEHYRIRIMEVGGHSY